jgi:hypothetical protein
VPAWLGSGEGSHLHRQMAAFSLYPYMDFPCYVCMEREIGEFSGVFL